MNLALRMAAMGILLLALSFHPAVAHAQGTAFTYQGRLNVGGNPASGSYDLRFAVFDADTNGNPQGPALTNAATAVSNGLFSVALDFGNQFPGADRWLEIAVGTNGSGNFTTLNPRQALTATPYAITAGNVVPGGIPAGSYTNAVFFSNANNQFAGNGAGLTNLGASSLTGILNATNLPANVVTNLVLRPAGTNDQTAAIQAAFSTPFSVIWFTPGIYYATNLWLTSNVTIYGNGATLCQLSAPSQGFAAGITDWIDNTNWNALLNMGSANVNQRIYNLVLDGMRPANYEGQNFPIWTGVNRGFYALPLCATGNHGLLFNQAAGGEVSGCVAQNFSGCGFFITSSADQLSYQGPHSLFHDNVALTNFCGFYVQSYGGTHPSMYGNAEYSLLSGLVANNNTVGLDDGASNSQLHDSTLNYNYIGLNITGGNGNSGPHTRFHHINLNHDYCGFWIGGTDYIAIDNFYEAATETNFVKNGHPSFYNSSLSMLWIDGQGVAWSSNTWITFNGCELNGINITSNNVSIENSKIFNNKLSFTGNTLAAYNNRCDYPFTNWLTEVITNLNNGGTYIGFGNHQTSGTSNDGSYAASLPGITTNVSTAGTTFYITNGLIMRISTP